MRRSSVRRWMLSDLVLPSFNSSMDLGLNNRVDFVVGNPSDDVEMVAVLLGVRRLGSLVLSMVARSDLSLSLNSSSTKASAP